MAIYSRTHTPTEEVPILFKYPSTEECTLIAEKPALAKNGCPRCAMQDHPYQSCSHGLDSFVCEYAVKK